jgi:lipoyl(octanoyl) transferase
VVGAPGIYVRLADPAATPALTGPAPGGDPFRGLGKVAALGIKVSRHCTYHGVALNVAMDLDAVLGGINPCGYAALKTVDLARLGLRFHRLGDGGAAAGQPPGRAVHALTHPTPAGPHCHVD